MFINPTIDAGYVPNGLLANTGAAVMVVLSLAAGLLGAGWLLLAYSRRRETFAG